ncbi:MAG TPA: tRNA guanosine(15) transglycosylase TgtA, partial [Nitrososphaerales archaeon]|nr:tRNA guanosine(15) transglycosylase TgtA [Nitrososphaerales archaeon]
GLVMTDSGGYQALEYGGVDVTCEEIAEFQMAIGSDLAVTLDRPTGLSGSREYALETVAYSLKNAIKTIRTYRDGGTVWVGPIQGGLFTDLLAKSAASLLEAGFEFLALGSPTEVMENYMFTDLVRMISMARKKMPYSTPLHLFGAGHPLTMALSVALGCDTFDSASYILFARQERYMSERGTLELRRMQYLPCSCPVCSTTTVGDLTSMERGERVKRLALHNLFLLRKELMTCREAVTEGRLWDLVEERAAAHPRLSEAFREMAAQTGLMKTGTSLFRERGLFLRSETDEQRPELKLASERLGSVKRRGNNSRALLLPLTRARRPPGVEPLLVKKLGTVDLYRQHPRLGVYPAELDFIYPFTQTVELRETERRRKSSKRNDSAETAGGLEELRRMGYKQILTATPTREGGKLRIWRKKFTRGRRRRRRSPSPSSRSPASRSR